ncbi:HYC_CC_PP family protein [Salegentibacter sp. HM20]
MKALLLKISSIILTFLMFFSTVSFTVDKHFCCDELMDLAIFSSAENCGMESHDHGDENTIVGKECCENHQTFIQGQDELLNINNFVDLEQVVFITTFTLSYFNLFNESSEQIVPFKNYNAPFLVQEIHILNETYLI